MRRETGPISVGRGCLVTPKYPAEGRFSRRKTNGVASQVRKPGYLPSGRRGEGRFEPTSSHIYLQAHAQPPRHRVFAPSMQRGKAFQQRVSDCASTSAPRTAPAPQNSPQKGPSCAHSSQLSTWSAMGVPAAGRIRTPCASSPTGKATVRHEEGLRSGVPALEGHVLAGPYPQLVGLVALHLRERADIGARVLTGSNLPAMAGYTPSARPNHPPRPGTH